MRRDIFVVVFHMSSRLSDRICDRHIDDGTHFFHGETIEVMSFVFERDRKEKMLCRLHSVDCLISSKTEIIRLDPFDFYSLFISFQIRTTTAMSNTGDTYAEAILRTLSSFEHPRSFVNGVSWDIHFLPSFTLFVSSGT